MKNKLLKKFTSILDITFEDIGNVLCLWETNEVNEEDVFIFAEDLYYLDTLGWPDYPRDDTRSILFAVLESLEKIYSQPTLKDDIPALKKFLNIGQASPIDAWSYIDNYWDSIDWDKRLIELHNNRYRNNKEE